MALLRPLQHGERVDHVPGEGGLLAVPVEAPTTVPQLDQVRAVGFRLDVVDGLAPAGSGALLVVDEGRGGQQQAGDLAVSSGDGS
ncbi:hypothetical protein AB0D57_36410 [Streptomyces sp. NPDC048275]|uniref:hypothetical protein n=1 Tax=Streptomyces sp. NPDC048275 TaxID=3155629 RepID=UPI0033D6828C